MKLGKSQREKEDRKVVSVAVIREGKLLFGLRGDSGKWNLPGGHLEPGESPRSGAERELKEETGLTGRHWEPLGFCDVREGLRVYSFMCEADGEPTAKDDPDEEMKAFAWAPIKRMPSKITQNLHNKQDVTLQFLDLQDRALDLIWDEDGPRAREIEALFKADGPFRGAGFRHKVGGQVYETGPFHNIEPWLLGGAANHEPTGPHDSSDWEAGFVTHDGNFMNREQAAAYVNAPVRRHPITGAPRHSLDSQDPEAGLRKGSLDEILAKVKAQMAYMKELDKTPQPRQFARRGGGHVVVSYDPSKPGRWRATTLDHTGNPLGHVEAEDHYSALKAAHHSGAIIEPPTPVQKYEQDLELWLAKATKPEHFKSIAMAVSPEGPRFVNHVGQMVAHPAAINHEVEHYRNEVLNGPVQFQPKKGKEGMTRKVIFQTHQQPQDLLNPTRVTMNNRYMVKPYHEGIVKRTQKWQKYPIQGWAEMTNQALYHAGGIGHLHQKVHVSEHDMGAGHEKEPALVVHLEPGYHQVFDSDFANSGRTQMASGKPVIDVQDSAMHDVRKIALMDFLSNNLDRHGGNLLISGDGKNIKVIDHSRSFQYFNTHQYRSDGREVLKGIRDLEDRFHPYIAQSTSAIHKVDPYLRDNYDEDMRRLQNYRPVFEWWGQNSAKIKAAFEDQLTHVKDETVRKHLLRNFRERAKWLDERAEMGLENYGTDWHRDTVPQYHDDQTTDEEREAERIKKLRTEYEAEQAKVG